MENNKNKILALKYRPKNFKELIGQDIMAETISNSIKFNKLPNGYLLTGIRGTGKTTTARIIAKALNCNKHFDHGDKDKVEEFCNCEEISDSKHLDVLEMDAASKTGIDDIRELIESSKYNPTVAKYKVIILDEVHMLSKQAFNGLLKTLEEPPPHLKFIFATTEVKKIPVTIISRCQRFDLHRVEIKELVDNLKKIAKAENGNISEEALILIAKASEGSVRDSLSLLDRAIVSQSIDEKEINENFVRKMIGIVDRSKTLNLLNLIFEGKQKKATQELREMINQGIDPINFLNDLLESIHLIQQQKSFKDFDFEFSISESEQEKIKIISERVNIDTLIIFWQLTLKAIDEMAVVSNPILALEMLIVRLVHIKEIPSYENLISSLKENNDNKKIKENEPISVDLRGSKKSDLEDENKISDIPKDQIKNVIQTKPTLSNINDSLNDKDNLTISSFEDLIKLSSEKREVHLKYDLEKNVNLIKFSQGKIDISLNESLDKNFVRSLSEKLFEWTGNRWVITLTKERGQMTYLEQQNIKKKQILNEEKKSKVYQEFKDVFSDGELLEINKKKKI